MKKPSDLVHDENFSVELCDIGIEIAIDWDDQIAWKYFDLGEAKAIRNKLTEMIEYLEGLRNE
jgi:hypothetical protein